MRRPRSQRRSARQRAIRPPLRGGVNACPLVLPEADFATLGEWAVSRFGPAGEGLFSGDIFYDFAIPALAADPYRPGTRLHIFRPVPDEPAEPIVLDVVHRAERFVVVDKPHGIATIPRGSYVARSVTIAARRQFSNDDVAAAHRLDAETAGLVLLTEDPRWRGPYQDMFAARKVTKIYEAVARCVDLGRSRATCRVWRRPRLDIWGGAGGSALARSRARSPCTSRKESPTRLPISARFANCATPDLVPAAADGEATAPPTLALYELRPITGRLHQLRATLNYLGAPIAGDPLYPKVLSLEDTAARSFPTQLLAAQLSFVDPVDGEQVHIRTRRTLQFLTLRLGA
ncbi:pseudouridine synthase [Trueperella pyogenes]|uniref:pseudouridine synthase n=1 Tax=Trueperella pyogenes TaxID=1661 RepID=UPI001432BDF8|nr:pseudouridine synthase [Trueperella pyogenes]QIU86699.1 hypothetical protein HEP79_05385 [Trueperella pyogenes]